jgi:carbon monoxide dehydrogenase subunit G
MQRLAAVTNCISTRQTGSGMEVQLNKRYPVAASPAQAWTVLGHLQATAACMPGAALTESVDERHHKGTVRAKVGPAQLLFHGDLEVLALEPDSHRLELLGKGADRAGSSASLRLKAWLEPGADSGACQLVGEATVTVSGKLAQLGSRLLVPVSDALLAQFAVNFEKAALAVPAPALAEPVSSLAVIPVASPLPAPSATTAVVPLAPATPPPALNALTLLWTALKAWIAGLFKGKR